MSQYEVSLTFLVSANSTDAAMELARQGHGEEINSDVVEIPRCGFCGAMWPKTVRLSWVDENRQACEEERCTSCVPMKPVGVA